LACSTFASHTDELKMSSKKQSVSVRLSLRDVEKIKKIAVRLNVSDSDVILFSIKGMLSKLRPLSDSTITGYQLLPVFIEHGNEVSRHFDLDAEKLDHIINMSDSNNNIDRADLELIAMQSMYPNYLKMQLESLLSTQVDEKELPQNLRKYLYSKYQK